MSPFAPKPDTTPEEDTSPIQRGTVFDTKFETYCVALDKPDIFGNFDAIGPNGDISAYSVNMVDYIHMSQYPLIRL